MSLEEPPQHRDLATGPIMDFSNFSSYVGSSQSFGLLSSIQSMAHGLVPAVLPPSYDGLHGLAFYKPGTDFSWHHVLPTVVSVNGAGRICSVRCLGPGCPFMKQECPQPST